MKRQHRPARRAGQFVHRKGAGLSQGEPRPVPSRRGVKKALSGGKLRKANIRATRRAALRVALSELSAEARRRPADYFTACVGAVLVLLASELEGLLA